MSNRSARRYIETDDYFLPVPIVIAFFLLSIVALSHSEIVSSYTRDVVNEEAYCASQYATPEKHEDANCQSFWYRTFNDPSIYWSFIYDVLTFFLVGAATTTIIVALRSISIQRDEANRLFIADQRPVIKIELTSSGFLFDERGDLCVRVNMRCVNVGKTEAAIFLCYSLTPVELQKAKDQIPEIKMRAKAFLDLAGIKLFPGAEYAREDTARFNKTFLDLTFKIDKSTEELQKCMKLFLICAAYKSRFSDEIYIDPLAFQVHMLGTFGPYPRDADEAARLGARPTIQVFTRGADLLGGDGNA